MKLELREETVALLSELKSGRVDGWVKVDWGDADVIDMIGEALNRFGFGTKTEEEVLEIAKEYEEEATGWAKREGLEVNYRIPVRINIVRHFL